MSADNNNTSGRIRPGALLQQARDSAGLTLAEISEKTRILLPRLEALENNDYAAAGASATFIVGYIRAYARAVNASPGPILKAFEADYSVSDEEPRPAEQVYVPMENSTRGGFPVKTIVLVLIIIVVAIIVAQKLTASKSVTSPINNTSKSSSLQLPEHVENATSTEGQVLARDIHDDKHETSLSSRKIKTISGSDSSLTQKVSGVHTIELDSSYEQQDNNYKQQGSQHKQLESRYKQLNSHEKQNETAPAPSVASLAARSDKASSPSISWSAADSQAKKLTSVETSLPQIPQSGDFDTLQMSFTDQCWVKVHDNTGKRIVYKLAKAGDQVHVQGEAPFDLLLGNAEAASVQVNGRAVNTEPDIGKRKLRKKVGPKCLKNVSN